MKGQTPILERIEPSEPAPALLEAFPPVLARAYAARGIQNPDEVRYRLDSLPPPAGLAGMDAATALLERALREGWRVLVVGDFDADGATSTAVAVRGLRAMGAADVDFLVPNRFEYGYGLTPEIVAAALQPGGAPSGSRRDVETPSTRAPDLIVTVDNGVSSLRGVAAAREAGVRVLVTDHHLPGDELPDADALVDPAVVERTEDSGLRTQGGSRGPGTSTPSPQSSSLSPQSSALAGVGVIFYVLLGLRSRLRDNGWFAERGIAPPNMAAFLDLVALGTVADVVPLDRINRVLVAQGVARIRSGHACPGVAALMEIAGRRPERLVAGDLGFAVGPRLNAAGRLDDMGIGIRCLLAERMDDARTLAAQLDNLNRERQGIEQQMQSEALARVAEAHLDSATGLPVGLCLYDPDWHQGVVGIVASRVKDRLHRPVIAFTDSGDGKVKGSARSIPGLHIRDALDAVATRHPGLLRRFGGHAMAAGLTLERGALEAFREAFDAEVRRLVREEDLTGRVVSEGALEANEVDLELAETVRSAGPWGQGFPEPVFDGIFEVVDQRIVGERHLKLVLRWADSGRNVAAILFNADLDQWPAPAARVEAAYRLDVNEFRGERSLQLRLEYLRPL